MMEEKLWLKELSCFKPARQYSGDGYFDLKRFPTEKLREQIRAFLLDQAEQYSCVTMAKDRRWVKELSEFYSRYYPTMHDIQEIPLAEQQNKFRKFLLSKDEQPFRQRVDALGHPFLQTRRSIRLMEKWMDYAHDHALPEEEKDIWHLDRFSFPIHQSAVRSFRTISFKKIKNVQMKEEIKKACFLRLHYGSVMAVCHMKSEGTFFANYLMDHHSEIASLTELTREVLEDYFAYTRTDKNARKIGAKSLAYLQGLLTEVENISGAPLSKLIISSDYPKEPIRLFRSFSKEDLKKIHKAYEDLPEQYTRALVVHELLGTRISDTLTLRQDCLSKRDGAWFIRIDQPKTRASYSKPINEKIALLIQAAIKYTTEKFGKREYVFVRETNPDMPMQYNALAGAMRRAFYKNDVRDENGKRIGTLTHLFRHTYGQRLTELDVDDIVISKLLGHRSPSPVRYYRKMSSKAMAEQTKNLREQMDKKLEEIIKEWDDGKV